MSQLLFQAKAILNSAALATTDVDGNAIEWDIDLSVQDGEGVFQGYNVVLGDFAVFNTADLEPGSLSLYEFIAITDADSYGVRGRVRFSALNGAQTPPSTLDYSVGTDSIITRKSDTVGNLAIPSPTIQQIPDKFSFYLTNLNLLNTVDQIPIITKADWDAAPGSFGEILHKPTLGTAAGYDVPASGDAAFNQVVLGSDSRLGGINSSSLQPLGVSEGDTSPDPGNRVIVWSTTQGVPLVWTGTVWSTLVFDTDLKSVEQLNTLGFLVRTEPGVIQTRVLGGTPGQIQIVDPNGVANSPSIALVNTGVAPGTYTKVSVDAQGRVTSASNLVAADIPTDYLHLYKENYDGGADASATGSNAVAIGNGATAQAVNSIALGEHAIARHQGAVMQSAGRFTVSGDAQVGSYILKGATTSNIPRFLYLDGPSGTTPLIIPDNTTVTFKITVTAHRSDVNDGRAGFYVKGMIYRLSGPGTTSLQGAPSVEIISRTNPSWNINIVADNVNGCLGVMVTGESGKIIRWMAHIETVEITS